MARVGRRVREGRPRGPTPASTAATTASTSISASHSGPATAGAAATARAREARAAALRGVPVGEVPDGFGIRYGVELPLPVEAIARRQAADQEQMLADDPIGRDIASLDAETDHLLDGFWLAWNSAS
jgi:hypothetical protein